MLERLAARVLHRCPLGLAARDLHVVAMHPVVADLETGDPGARPLPLFEFVQEGAGIIGEAALLVEPGVESGRDHPPVPQHDGGGRHN